MDNLDDSEKNAKISDSAYSNSCSNSQSRTSYSCKSTHSCSNSSGSSGYGGKHFTSGTSCNTLNQTEKRCSKKDGKKKKSPNDTIVPAEGPAKVEQSIAEDPPAEPPIEEKLDVVLSPKTQVVSDEITMMEESVSDKGTVKEEMGKSLSTIPLNQSDNMIVSRPGTALTTDGFSCVISMLDGIVMYTTASLITSLGYPKDMWVGRSFIDFVHPRDRNTFASQITNGLAIPKNASGLPGKVPCPTALPASTMFCRIRKYRGIQTGFGVKEKVVVYVPFHIKLSFKNINEEESKQVYLVIQATPVFSAYKIPKEVMIKPVPFVMRHLASGALDYVDPESVPFLGFLPQDIMDKDVLQLYHNDDLNYLRQVYSLIVKEGGVPRSKPFRMMAQNGDYVTFETEWSSFINPWSRKLEFVTGKHHVIEGPMNPNVFQSPEPEKPPKRSDDDDKKKAQNVRESIIRIIDEVLTKPAEAVKQQMSKRCQDLASFVENLLEHQPKTEEELRLVIQDPDYSYYERDSVMIGEISPHHDFSDSKSSTETPLSYNQLNYNETLQRYFDSHQCSYPVNSVTPSEDHLLTIKEVDQSSGCAVLMAQYFGDSYDMSSSCESSAILLPNNELCCAGDYPPMRLTKIVIQKHNSEMEKEFVKKHREHKSSSKSEREKASNKTRQKKKEHLARCNASFQPTSAEIAIQDNLGNHGVKRSSKQIDIKSQPEQKHHCSNRPRPKKFGPQTVQSSPISIQSPLPMNHSGNVPHHSTGNVEPLASTSKQAQQKQPANAMQYMMYGQAIPFVYSPEGSFVTPNMQNISDGNGINAMDIGSNYIEPHGTKRSATLGDSFQTSHKHHCTYARHSRPRHKLPIPQSQLPNQMLMNPSSNMSNMISGIGIPQQMQMINPVGSMQGMFPLYYAQSTASNTPSTIENSRRPSSNEQNPPGNMQYLMHGQAVIGSLFTFSPVSPQMAFLLQQSLIDQAVQFTPTSQLPKNQFEEKNRATSTLKIAKSHQWREKKRAESQTTSSFSEQENSNHFCSSTNALKRASGVNTIYNDKQCDGSNSSMDTSESKSVAWTKSTEAVPEATTERDGKKRLGTTSEEEVDRTDGESSYSSFYSSFFKTESGSAEESGDAKKSNENKNARFELSATTNQTQSKKFIKRRLEPPWMEQVSVTPELIYKYQIITKGLDEILLADKAKISTFEQPSLVNEQLNQLYLDLQLEGVAAKLTLEEGITSSSSSGEETTNANAAPRKKREYSKLVMIYEEDAPLPPPDPKENLPSITRSSPTS